MLKCGLDIWEIWGIPAIGLSITNCSQIQQELPAVCWTSLGSSTNKVPAWPMLQGSHPKSSKLLLDMCFFSWEHLQDLQESPDSVVKTRRIPTSPVLSQWVDRNFHRRKLQLEEAWVTPCGSPASIRLELTHVNQYWSTRRSLWMVDLGDLVTATVCDFVLLTSFGEHIYQYETVIKLTTVQCWAIHQTPEARATWYSKDFQPFASETLPWANRRNW